MKTSERHHLKENEVAIALRQAGEFAARNQRNLSMGIIAVVVIAAAAIGFFMWRNSVNGNARAMLAEAMVVQEARVVAPTPGAEGAAATQQPGTYPTEQAKLEAALPKFLAAADAYPRTDAGQMARYQAASALVSLGRYDEGIKQYEDVIDDNNGLVAQMARLGKAEAQLRAARYDAAIAAFKELSDRTDLTVPKEALLFELARAYKLAGKPAEATQTLNQIVEQHGESPFAAEARQELDKLKG